MSTSTANTLTFGIEIECYIPNEVAQSIQIGGYHRGVQVESLPRGWNAQRDASIQAPAGKTAIEIVSPVLVGASGLEQVVEVLTWLKSIGAGCNSSCGIHVHVGANKLTAWKVLAITAQHEKALFAACGKNGLKRLNNRFCKSIAEDNRIKADYNSSRSKPSERALACSDRYQTLNLTNIWGLVREAVEFRSFASTFKVAEVLGYIRLCLGIVDYAVGSKMPFKFESKSVPTTATGEAQMKSLLGKLSWGKGNWGWVEGGNVNAEAAKAVLVKSAKSFDEGR
jgi:hypothetical protein